MRQYFARKCRLYIKLWRREGSEHTDAAAIVGNIMSAVYKNRGRDRSLNTLMRQYFARQGQLYTRIVEEGGVRRHWCGCTLQDNVRCTQEHGRREESEYTNATAVHKTMLAVYKNRGGGRSQNLLMRWFFSRQFQLYTRIGDEGGVYTHWCGSLWQDNVSCIQGHDKREESEHTDETALRKTISAVY